MKKRFTLLSFLFVLLCAACTPPSDSPSASPKPADPKTSVTAQVDPKIHGVNVSDMSIEQALSTYTQILLAVPGTAASDQKISEVAAKDSSLVIFLGQDGVNQAVSDLKKNGLDVNVGWVASMSPQWGAVRTLPHNVQP